jgi:hypothetical protein
VKPNIQKNFFHSLRPLLDFFHPSYYFLQHELCIIQTNLSKPNTYFIWSF